MSPGAWPPISIPASANSSRTIDSDSVARVGTKLLMTSRTTAGENGRGCGSVWVSIDPPRVSWVAPDHKANRNADLDASEIFSIHHPLNCAYEEQESCPRHELLHERPYLRQPRRDASA